MAKYLLLKCCSVLTVAGFEPPHGTHTVKNRV